jgi:deoxycytidylate deaminase
MKFADILKVTSALKRAKAMSKLSDHPDFRIGAVIVRQGIIISSAWNHGTKSHTYVKRYGQDLIRHCTLKFMQF